MMPVQPQTLLVGTIKTRSPPLSRRVEARPSRLFEARAFARNFGEAAARELPRDQARCHRELAQDRANRSKKAKVIYRRIDIFEPTRLLPAWGDDPRIRPYIEIVEFI